MWPGRGPRANSRSTRKRPRAFRWTWLFLGGIGRRLSTAVCLMFGYRWPEKNAQDAPQPDALVDDAGLRSDARSAALRCGAAVGVLLFEHFEATVGHEPADPLFSSDVVCEHECHPNGDRLEHVNARVGVRAAAAGAEEVRDAVYPEAGEVDQNKGCEPATVGQTSA